MADQEHLDILKLGVEIWNKWREGHQDILLNLSGADLRRADLSEAKLTRADLRHLISLTKLQSFRSASLSIHLFPLTSSDLTSLYLYQAYSCKPSLACHSR